MKKNYNTKTYSKLLKLVGSSLSIGERYLALSKFEYFGLHFEEA
jgi:hypothetical protein